MKIKSLWVSIAAFGLLMVSAGAQAQTDIASAPLVTSTSADVLPNLMFVIDDSGSMAYDYLPDHVSGSQCRAPSTTNPTRGTYNRPCCQNDANAGAGSSVACLTGAAPTDTWRGHPPFLSSDYNGIYYNPAIRYTPPVGADGTSYPSQTSAATGGWSNVKIDAYGIQSTGSVNLLTQFPDTEWCTVDKTQCLRNDNYVLPGVVAGVTYNTYRATVATGSAFVASGPPDNATTSQRDLGPHYYVMNPVEWCDSIALRNCQSAQSLVYSFPAKLRWCTNSANAGAMTPTANTCQALRTSTYGVARYATVVFGAGTPAVPAVVEKAASVSFAVGRSGTCSSTSQVAFSAVNVGSVGNLLSATTGAADSVNNMAAAIRAGINARSPTLGYVATGSNATVTITAPTSAGNLTGVVTLSKGNTSNCNATTTTTPAFSGYVAPVPAVPAGVGNFPGSFARVDIVPSRTSYPKDSERGDCAATAACTYDEEMTNFANWWAYYHTRMQAMKTSASLAFQPVSNRYRLGFFSINNNTTKDFLNLDTFDGTQKTTWFSKLRATKPSGSTPLRGSLSKIGRLYGGRLNASTLNGSKVVDPMQFSCQQNFTILSTDGYWNESATPVQLDGSTAIGDYDTGLPRPLLDGNVQSNTLADVAAYYYQTDLRTGCGGGPDVCDNGVNGEKYQRMTTFTLGLGVSGYMQFVKNYASATSGDYFAVLGGLAADPANGICAWQASGTTCNWPIPANNNPTGVDDLWHAALTGHGTYFSATDPSSLRAGLSSALSTINARLGNAAAVAVSNPNAVSGDNFVFSSSFTSGEWSGNLVRRRIDLGSGVVATDDDWRTQPQLDSNTARNVVLYDAAGTGSKLKAFDWDHLSTTEKSYFSLAHITTSGRALTQFCLLGDDYCLSTSGQADAAGSKLVSFLRGSRADEGPANATAKYFRERAHLLGDIVDAEAVYVKSAVYQYVDAGYGAFKGSVTTRQGMVYVGANDGMFHAFNAETGAEVWSYVPSMVIPNLYRLADKEYESHHQYYVNAPAASGDVYDGASWRTIVVSGLGAGGRGYFALDVTNPASPKALWEFTSDTTKGAGYTTSANLGLSFGKPEITKLKNGTWVVIVGSGYNNVSAGTGRGYLFVLDAVTGALIRTIDTGVGSTAAPAGLAHIRAWVDATEVDNTVQRVYAGDNLGNLWRFDVNGDVGAAGYDAQLLAQLRNADGEAQPVTARPELGLVDTHAMVYVGTGRFMGLTDIADTSRQTFYGIKDGLAATGYGTVRDEKTFVQQEMTAGTCGAGSSVCVEGKPVRFGSSKPVDLAVSGGWFIDLPVTGERAYTDPQLGLGTIAFTTNIAGSSACEVGGSSYLNYLDYRTGAPVSTASGVVSAFLGENLATAPTLMKLPNGKVVAIMGNLDTRLVPTNQGTKPARRVSWRELPVDR